MVASCGRGGRMQRINPQMNKYRSRGNYCIIVPETLPLDICAGCPGSKESARMRYG